MVFYLSILSLFGILAGNGEAVPREGQKGLYAIRAGKILTVTQGAIDHGLILIREGRIEAVGRGLEIPEGYQIVDASDKWVYPGLVEIHSHIGVGWGINDMVLPLNPELQLWNHLEPDSAEVLDALANGITTILAIPGSGTNVSGFGVLYKTFGKTADDMIVRRLGVLKVAQAWNPERPGGDLGASRMGMSWMLRDLLRRARDYTAAWDAFERGEKKERPPWDPTLEPLKGLFHREYPVLVHTASARDVMATMRLFHDEFKVPCILSHGEFQGFAVGREAGLRNLPVNIGPRIFDYWFVDEDRFYGIAANYVRQGTPRSNISFNTDAGVVPQDELFHQVCMAVRFGFEEGEALRSVTLNPARAVLMEHRIGSIEAGKDADLVIKGGPPFDLETPVEGVFVNGQWAFDFKKPRRYHAGHYRPGRAWGLDYVPRGDAEDAEKRRRGWGS
jgi:imidazolonepropionase-like amidohydrolase